MLKSYIRAIALQSNFKYKLFIIKVLIFIILLISLDFSIGSILNYFYFRQESGFQYRTTYSIEKTNAEILIFGPSRANTHYYPPIFEKSLHMSCYNTGRDGNPIFNDYAILNAILKRYSPKIIILDFSIDYDIRQESYDRISALLPYYHTHPEIHSIVNLKSRFEKYKLYSKIYPFNSSIFSIIAGNTQRNKKRTLDIKGYMPVFNTWHEPIVTVNHPLNYELDSTKLEIYESFIEKCITSNIRLYVVCSPYYIKYNFLPPDILMGEQIAKKYKIKFFNHLQEPSLINNNAYFQEPYHLNDEGAKLFSKIIVDEIVKDQNQSITNIEHLPKKK